ncbi:hypothetical protein OG339_48455 (plasmid) [Streptosporangium sp. NBC_01495]|uniref:hypothetical protein n=1 Tax=Streptosporangium sp. NBC_01495 TaxID=2903899 RepID=UPI002E379EF0|nr:hypothetical protein [Streptosporangium sp. NBC_01495]
MTDDPITFPFAESGSLTLSWPDPEYAGWDLAQAGGWVLVAEISGYAVGVTADQVARLAELLQKADESQAIEDIAAGPEKDLAIRVIYGAGQVELSVFVTGSFAEARVIIPLSRCQEVHEALATVLPR